MNKRKKILFCPLDWGLGHATRCIPLIRFCIEQHCQVIVAGTEKTNALIGAEFPSLQYISLSGYQIRYAKKGGWLPLILSLQIPRLLKAIRNERAWLKDIVRTHQIDLVVSDNRYGLAIPELPCIFMTHQLQIKVPQSGLLQILVNRVNHYFLEQFSAIWIPDYADHGMSGELSLEGKNLPPIAYLGNLSRFEKAEPGPFLYDKIFLLSGPEPQRSILEEKILSQIKDSSERILIVQGRPEAGAITQTNKQLRIVSHLPTVELQTALRQSAMIICRSGYSTIMDLIKINRHALLIATPGQTEQEYLANYLSEKKWFLSARQKDLDLAVETLRMKDFQFTAFPDYDAQYQKVLLPILTGTEKAK